MSDQTCNCFEQTLNKLKDHVQSQLDERGIKHEDLEIGWQNRTYILGSGEHSPVNPKIEVSYQGFKKNGEPARNRNKEVTSVMASHCMFCGRKYQNETKSQADE